MDGLLLIDKPVGPTSHDIVAKVRHLLRMTAVGHAGTLDPFASGLMVLLLGQATKISDYILSQDKRYEIQFCLGKTSDTGDVTGTITNESPIKVSTEQVLQALSQHLGDLQLVVPKFSAIKIGGKKLYSYAHENKVVELPTRTMHFYDLKIIKMELPEVVVEVSCHKGGYIRSWVPSLGEKLGTGALVTALRRLESKPYHVQQAITLDKLKTYTSLENPQKKTLTQLESSPSYIPLLEALPHLPSYTVHGKEETLLRHGQIAHNLANRLVVDQKVAFSMQKPVGIKILDGNGGILGLIEAIPSQGLKIKRIFSTLS
ncbi:MAG: tRNA pseudouridine(55) synthase TruB [Bdellovibrionales bacterium]|nr:tRNA pseudouridine(55) synthase TruB [Bdellovibrionales bacterium]